MLITSADLKSQSKNDLAQTAKRLGVAAWNTLTKDQLVAAIVKHKKTAAKSATKQTSAPAKKTDRPKTGDTKSGNKSGAKTNSKKQAPVSRMASKPVFKTAAGKSANKTPAASKPANKSTTKQPVKSGKVLSAKGSAASAEKVSGKSTATTNGKGVHAGKANGSESKSKPALMGKVESTKAKANGPVSDKGSLKGAPVVKEKDVAAKEVASKIAATKKPAAPKKPAKPTTPPTNPAVLQRIRELQVQRESTKDLAREFEEVVRVEPPKPEPVDEPQQKDRIVLVVRDAFWLQVTWDITRRAVERARAAMAEHWHHAQPILRLLRLDDSGTTSAAETIERDIVIHGGVRNWYLDLNGTPGRFRVMIGYLSGTRFHMLAKSNIVRTPTPGTDATEDHWSDIARDAERIFALSGGYDSEQETTELQEVFEDRLKRSMGGPQLAQYGSGAETAFRGRGGFHFDMEVELYVYGSTVPDGFVTLNNEPVKLRSDGTFSLRLPFPDRRQVLPAVACSRDGVQQRTVVVAVERNTKVMEPFSKEQDDPG
ncbi:MAG: DUF4912 domain-containing protein [Pirellulaceae bacterium]|nr:DUF4912 domain-containing protein [Pirellulaceae bacterium]